MEPAFWLRGLLPAGWTSVPAPPEQEDWFVTGTNTEIGPSFLGHGPPDRPLVLFGDASGGADAASKKFRRVGVAVTLFRALEPEVDIAATISGALAGPRQAVPRGELRAFLLAW